METSATRFQNLLTSWKNYGSAEIKKEENAEKSWVQLEYTQNEPTQLEKKTGDITVEKQPLTRFRRSKSLTHINAATQKVIETFKEEEKKTAPTPRPRTKSISDAANARVKKLTLLMKSKPSSAPSSPSSSFLVQMGNATESSPIPIEFKSSKSSPDVSQSEARPTHSPELKTSKSFSLSETETHKLVQKSRDEAFENCVKSITSLKNILKDAVNRSKTANESELFALTNLVKTVALNLQNVESKALDDLQICLNQSSNEEYKKNCKEQTAKVEEFTTKMTHFSLNLKTLHSVLEASDAEICDQQKNKLDKKELVAALRTFLNGYKILEAGLNKFKKAIHSDKKVLVETHALIRNYFKEIKELSLTYLSTLGYRAKSICKKKQPIMVTAYRHQKLAENVPAFELLSQINRELAQYLEFLKELLKSSEMVLKLRKLETPFNFEAEEYMVTLSYDLKTYIGELQKEMNSRLSLVVHEEEKSKQP